MKTYNDLINYKSFDDRLEYLKIDQPMFEETFGTNRFVNQKFYKSAEWLQVRRAVIIRDKGCDLGCVDRPIYDKIIIHHIEPITVNDIIHRTSKLLDMNNLICVSESTHKCIHYNSKPISYDIAERQYNDTKLW